MIARLVDGPDPWGERTVHVTGEGGGVLERWLQTEDTPDEWVCGIWTRTGELVPVQVERRRRNDVVVETKEALAYRFSGRRRVVKQPRRQQAARQMTLA